MIEIDFHNYLITHSALSLIVGGEVWMREAPQVNGGAVLPCITWEVSDRDHFSSIEGSIGNAHTSFDVTAWSDNYVECVTLTNEIRLALHGFTGMMGSTSVDFTLFDFESEISQSKQNASNNRYYSKISTFRIGHSESIPEF